MSNKDPKKLTPVETVVNQLVYQFGVRGLVLNALIEAICKQMPDTKEHMTAFLKGLDHSHLMAQAMIDEAIDYVKNVR
jgi:hypothetical protein